MKADSLAHHLDISRVFDAPRDLVFRAWTDVTQLNEWCHLDVLTTTSMRIDPRVGGEWVIELRAGDGTEVVIWRQFRDITPPARLVFHEVCRYGGKVILDGMLTVTFDDENGKTRLAIACDLTTPFDEENQQGWRDGWCVLFDRLAARMAAD